MKLTTTLNIKKILRTLLFYQYWKSEQKRILRAWLAQLTLKRLMLLQGVSTSVSGQTRIFKKKDHKIIVPLTDPVFENIHVVRHFDSFFQIEGLEVQRDTLDVTKPIRAKGYDIQTNIGMLLELVQDLDGYFAHYQPKPGDVVWDCGSFHGLFALEASKRVGENGIVYCLEPDPKNVQVLRRNLEANRISNVKIIEKGLWKYDGQVPFDSEHDATSCVSFSNEQNNLNKKNKTMIDVATIPSIFQSEQMTKIDFVKMDIEGAEIEAVESCLGFLGQHDVHFAIASYHLRDGTETYHKIESLFDQINYNYVTEVTSTIVTYAWPKE